MRNYTKFMLGLAVAIPLLALGSSGESNSGLKPGEMVTPFAPTHVTGADKGTTTCPVCKYGKTPAVQVWVNGDKPSNIDNIATTLEGAIKMEGPNKVKAFVIFVKPANQSKARFSARLKAMASRDHLENVALLYVDGNKSEAVEQYKINTSGHVKNTVIVYHDETVNANFVNLSGDEKGLMALKNAMMKACGM
jgi:protocatechuate 3,4-dioxygenase, beta subunit